MFIYILGRIYILIKIITKPIWAVQIFKELNPKYAISFNDSKWKVYIKQTSIQIKISFLGNFDSALFIKIQLKRSPNNI